MKIAIRLRRIEGRVLRGFAWQMRAALGFQTRRPKDVPSTFPLGIVRNGKEEIITVPIKDQFVVLPLPLFRLPAFFERNLLKKDREYKEGTAITAFEAVWFSDPEQIRRQYNADRIFIVQKIDHVALAQMLAKIAYCLTVAELGLDAIKEVYVLPAILGKRNDIGEWVGSSDNVFEEVTGLGHSAQVKVYQKADPQTSDGLIIVFLRLFCDIPSPRYVVVVGRPK